MRDFQDTDHSGSAVRFPRNPESAAAEILGREREP